MRGIQVGAAVRRGRSLKREAQLLWREALGTHRPPPRVRETEREEEGRNGPKAGPTQGGRRRGTQRRAQTHTAAKPKLYEQPQNARGWRGPLWVTQSKSQIGNRTSVP